MPLSIKAQTSFLDQSVSASFTGHSLQQIIVQLDDQYVVDFYFDPAILPIEKIQIDFQDIPLRDLLDGLLKGTNLGYSPYENYAIIIAPLDMLDLEFTEEYYQVKYGQKKEVSKIFTEQEIIFGDPENVAPNGTATIFGQITDAQFGDPLIGTSLYIPSINLAVITDGTGNYEWGIPIGEYDMLVQSIGYNEIKSKIIVYSDTEWNFEMQPKAYNFEAVVVQETSSDENISSAQIGVERLSIKEIKALPALLGEPDVIQSLLTMPGITSVGEGATGFNVRGGSIDQNLITQDGALIFNSSHVLGFFSIFNSDLLKGVTLYNGNIPAQFGGRLSSYLEVETIDPDPEKFHIRGGVGIVSGKLTMEIPLIKGKTALLLGGRTSYSDWMLKLFRKSPDIRTSSVSFYDVNAKITQQLGGGSNLSLAYYRSNDNFKYAQFFGFKWDMQTLSTQWNQILTSWLSSNLDLIYGDVGNTSFDPDGIDAFALAAGSTYYKIRENFFLSLFNRQQIHFGVEWLRIDQDDEALSPGSEDSAVIPFSVSKDNGEELSFYINDEINLGARLSLSAGLRFTRYQQKGNERLYLYAGNDLPDVENQTDTIIFNKGDLVQTYQGWEPRLSLRFRIDEKTAIKLSFNRLNQYIHLISNTVAATPVDLWQLSTSYIPPQGANNFSIGVFRNFNDNEWETSLEGFYRIFDQVNVVRDLPTILLNDHLETEILPAIGKSYGLEFSVKRTRGKTRGRLSYTFSRSFRQTITPDSSLQINNGDWFPSSFDQPHSLKFTLSQQVNKRHTFSANFIFNSGRPITAPIGNYFIGATPIPLYSERNAFRIPAYHRLDLSYTIRRNAIRKTRYKGSWTFSIYNVYARKNVFTIFFQRDIKTSNQAFQFSVLGTALPAITYNFEF